MAPRTTSNISQVSHKLLSSISLPVNSVFNQHWSHADLLISSGGGDVKIESHKLNIKAKSKVGSMDNVGPGNGETNGHKVKLKHSH